MRKDMEPVQDTEQSDCKIVWLEIIRQRTFDTNKPYGSTSPEDGTHYIIDRSSQKIADKTKENILRSVQRDPDQLPCVIDALVVTGKYFESIKYEVPPIEKDSWVDGELSSRMVTETVLEIGEKALPFLEKSEEEYAKNLAKRLRRDITSKKIRGLFKKTTTKE